MRLSLVSLAVVGVALLSVPSTPASSPLVGCDSIIWPDQESALAWRPKRVVLGVVAVPPAYISQTTSSGVARWPYGSKSGLVVRGNSPVVTIGVPAAWRRRTAIGWGGAHAVSSLRIASCPATGAIKGWNPYAGGFYLRSRAACVPLVFRVGNRSATVRFGVGKRCA
jgi:hypothetical protein